MKKTKFSLGGGRASFAVFAVVFAAIVALALPTTALASASEKKTAKLSLPINVWYDSDATSYNFRCTVTDADDGHELTEGTDFTRSYAYVSDRRNDDRIDASAWKDTDEGMTSSGFVWERITLLGDYADPTGKPKYAYVRHNILTLYEYTEQSFTKVEGQDDPILTGNLTLKLGDPTTKIDPSAIKLSRVAGEKPGEYAITYTTDPEQLPATGSNTAGTRTGMGQTANSIYLVGDDICGFNYIKVIPGKLTIERATTDVTVTVAWKDSSNKDGVRPSAEDFAKLLSLTADGEASDAEPTVVDNGNDTYTVTYKGVWKYAYTDDDERYEIAYQVTQASVADYTTDKATVDNGGTITNTHEVKVTPKGEDKDPAKPAATEKTERKSNVPKTGDESVNTAAIVAVGAVVLCAAAVSKKRAEL